MSIIRVHRILGLGLAVYLSASCCSPAICDDETLVKLNQTAQTAFDQGKFKKAQLTWTAAIHGMEDNGQKDAFLELFLKRLGQSYMRLEQCVDAYQALSRAKDMCLALGLQDEELQNELLQLSRVYRFIDPAELGEGTAIALKKANVTSVSLIKTGAHKGFEPLSGILKQLRSVSAPPPVVIEVPAFFGNFLGGMQNPSTTR